MPNPTDYSDPPDDRPPQRGCITPTMLLAFVFFVLALAAIAVDVIHSTCSPR